MNSLAFDTAAPAKPPAQHRLGPAIYGALFTVVLPIGLVAWAHFANDHVLFLPVQAPGWGLCAITIGSLLLIGGMVSLRVFGRGLPMNAYPPPQYVTRGAYALLRHPIYTGFALACIGVALLSGSAAGLWLVCPTVVLGIIALLLGYENLDLQNRFGPQQAEPFLHLPANTDQLPTIADRLSIYVFVLLPWAALYELLATQGPPVDAVVGYLRFEATLPVVQWTEALYAGTYVLVLLAPLVARTRRELRDFAVQGLLATGLMLLFFTTVPVIAPPRPFTPDTPLGNLLEWERHLDTSANAFPSYHVFWILLAGVVVARAMPKWRVLWWVLSAAMIASCLTTGMHSLVDVLAGLLLFIGVKNWRFVWERLRGFAERVANSWQEWRWGKLRLINHGIYGGMGAGLAVAIVGSLLGPTRTVPILFVAATALVTSALWAQFVEGCPSLLRPYGYYGGVLGIVLGSLLTGWLFGESPWLFLAAYSVAGPWVQSLGRLRCLVQGCCHGRQAPPAIGIVYRHPRSRVCRLSTLGGTPVHPTPLYSILWNAVLAAIMIRLWAVQGSLALIGGVYLVLTGLGRFVEEAYRGEPQTLSVAGLRLYQWIAVFTVVAGAVVTCVSAAPAPEGIRFASLTWMSAIGFGLLTWAALGVDFPASNRRFARLA